MVKYFSMFTGIGGFELGIQQAYEILCDVDGSEDGGIEENPSYDERQRFLTKERENTCAKKRPTSECSPNLTDERPLCVGFSEIDKYASQLLSIKFPKTKNYGDATKIDEHELPDFNLLVGGFPCQSFSIAGKRKGFDDTRGTLFFDIARILAYKKPRNVLLENVKGLLSHDGGTTFQTIVGVLTDLGYFVEWQVLNSKNFGVPQNRERVFIIGHLGTCQKLVFPIQYQYDISYNEKMYWLPEELASNARELLLRIQERQGKELSSTEMQNLLESIGEAIRQGQPCEVEKLSEDIRPESEGNIQKIETLGAFLESANDTGRVCGMVQEPTEEMLLLWSQREPVEGTPGQIQQQDDKNDHRQNGLIERLRNGESMPLLLAMQPYQGRLFFSIGDGKDWENIYQIKMETKCKTTLSSILEDSVDEKYFLSDKAIERMNIKGYSPTLSMHQIGGEQTEIKNKQPYE